ncbi:hypothetical protein [Peribacillus cavernae]|uniref:hypothetical protein n=1 Tax=Peribacillus cavernae TaxID=1674310 RepID=UPI00163B72D4|nr:hypothetical protein [Peribacillus cavernae]MDQ0219995.1 hypothetical protein [Peribacillus cavernae]
MKLKRTGLLSIFTALMLVLGACSNDNEDQQKDSNDEKMEENMDGMDHDNMDMDSGKN